MHPNVGCCWAFFLRLKKKGGVNTVNRFKVLSGLFVALLLVVTAQTAMAQSTIFNIPTTDTVSKGKGYFKFVFLSQVRVFDTTQTYVYNPLVFVGTALTAKQGLIFPTYPPPVFPPGSPPNSGTSSRTSSGSTTT